MSTSKLVYDDDRIEELSFGDGFSTGYEACKDGLVNWRPRLGLQGYWFAVMFLFCVPIVGQIIAFMRIQNAYAGAMRYEQLLLAGRSPKFKDAWSVFWSDLGLTQFSVMTFGLMIGGQIVGGLVSEIPYLSFLGAVGTLIGIPVLTGALTLASWSVALQGSSREKALDKFPKILAKGWQGLAGQLVFMWLLTMAMVAAGFFCVFLAVAALAVSPGGVDGAFWIGVALGIGALLVGSAAMLPLFGLGFHLLGRKMMMARVEVPDAVEPAPAQGSQVAAAAEEPAAAAASPAAPGADGRPEGPDEPINPINPN